MALANLEHEARFVRIETALEKLAEMQTAQAERQTAQAEWQTRQAEIQTRQAEGQSRLDSKLVLIAEGLLEIIAMHKKLEEAQAKTELMAQETQGRVDALVHVMDNWIREHGGKKNGNGEKPSA